MNSTDQTHRDAEAGEAAPRHLFIVDNLADTLLWLDDDLLYENELDISEDLKTSLRALLQQRRDAYTYEPLIGWVSEQAFTDYAAAVGVVIGRLEAELGPGWVITCPDVEQGYSPREA